MIGIFLGGSFSKENLPPNPPQKTSIVTAQELYSKLAAGEEQPYQLCGDEVPLLLNDYIVGERIEDYEKRRFPSASR